MTVPGAGGRPTRAQSAPKLAARAKELEPAIGEVEALLLAKEAGKPLELDGVKYLSKEQAREILETMTVDELRDIREGLFDIISGRNIRNASDRIKTAQLLLGYFVGHPMTRKEVHEDHEVRLVVEYRD